MILEEKIVKVIILISIFFGASNLFGQFQSFLPPFIFNYAVVGIVALYFSYRNNKEKDVNLLLLFSVSFVGISIFSGQFTYLISLFSSGKVLPLNYEKILFLLFLMFFLSIGIALKKLYEINTDKKNRSYVLMQVIIFANYIIFFIFIPVIADYLFLFFSLAFASNLINNKIILSPGLHRIALLLFLNFSLELLKIISIVFI